MNLSAFNTVTVQQIFPHFGEQPAPAKSGREPYILQLTSGVDIHSIGSAIQAIEPEYPAGSRVIVTTPDGAEKVGKIEGVKVLKDAPLSKLP